MHSTSNLEDGYLGSGKRLRYSIRKHGEGNHEKEILEFFDSRELLIEAEKSAITPDMLVDDMCMNLRGGGTGGFINQEHGDKCRESSGRIIKEKYLNDKAFKEKLDLALIKGRALVKEKWLTLEYREKMIAVAKKGKGKVRSEEIKEKMKGHKRQVGEKNSQYGTCWITKDKINKKIKKRRC